MKVYTAPAEVIVNFPALKRAMLRATMRRGAREYHQRKLVERWARWP